MRKIMFTLQGTNISPKNGILKMIFLFPRWDMLIPWRVKLLVQNFSTKNSGEETFLQENGCLKFKVTLKIHSPCQMMIGVYNHLPVSIST